MSDLEDKVVKNLKEFCRFLPGHVEFWKSVMKECKNRAIGLSNLSEQLRSVEKCDIKSMPDFKKTQRHLQYNILAEIEEEIRHIKDDLNRLNKTNQYLRNKLEKFENSTLNLDWENGSLLISGCAAVPSLSNLLQRSYDFRTFFSDTLKNINEKFKTLDLRNAERMTDFEKCFSFEEENEIYYLLALTQYVDDTNFI